MKRDLRWAPTIALSWTWGLGLFFSVQAAVVFGLAGLIAFVVPNTIGLALFGVVLGRRSSPGPTAAFAALSDPMRTALLAYQALAIALTVFAAVHYAAPPFLGAAGTVLGLLAALAAIASGWRCNAGALRNRHFVALGIFAAAMLAVAWGLPDLPPAPAGPLVPVSSVAFWGAAIPLCIGLLLGPWLDLQQWQRAIAIQAEGGSTAVAYVAGATLFGLIILLHGLLGLWAMGVGGATSLRIGLFDGLDYGHDIPAVIIAASGSPSVVLAYAALLAIALGTTLDSGASALRWFLQPGQTGAGALPPAGLCLLAPGAGLAASLVGAELEYFMLPYGTALVGFSAITAAAAGRGGAPVPTAAMTAVAGLSALAFAVGYLTHWPALQIAASLAPLLHLLALRGMVRTRPVPHV